jgi:hypothetical protein
MQYKQLNTRMQCRQLNIFSGPAIAIILWVVHLIDKCTASTRRPQHCDSSKHQHMAKVDIYGSGTYMYPVGTSTLTAYSSAAVCSLSQLVGRHVVIPNPTYKPDRVSCNGRSSSSIGNTTVNVLFYILDLCIGEGYVGFSSRQASDTKQVPRRPSASIRSPHFQAKHCTVKRGRCDLCPEVVKL